MCILEEISFTRKDGQYLRWDERSGRRQGVKSFNKGHIPTFDVAIDRKLREICQDLLTPSAGLLSPSYCDDLTADIEILKGSSLEILPKIDDDFFDCLVTSPPYCNRYDYTRTYALELAMLNVGEEEVRNLRQTMLSCTVENREKNHLPKIYHDTLVESAKGIFEHQQPLNKILTYLDECREAKLLNNDGIARMVRNYFWEMTLLIFEAARVLKPGSPFVMVNDNVRYQGAMIPVDLILSDIAEKAGFEVEKIWVLPNGKGNSSQQMGRHGREELRKSVYIWRVAKVKPTRMPNHPPASQSLDSPHKLTVQLGDR
jgi:DNA modification methylase